MLGGNFDPKHQQGQDDRSDPIAQRIEPNQLPRKRGLI
jgi:hypothetical protein